MNNEKELKWLAMNIVNQLFDLAETPVVKRQAINDEADAFVMRLLQQTPCTASLELLKQMLNDEYTAYNNNIDNYMKSSEHDYNVETIRNVIKLIEERQPMT